MAKEVDLPPEILSTILRTGETVLGQTPLDLLQKVTWRVLSPSDFLYRVLPDNRWAITLGETVYLTPKAWAQIQTGLRISVAKVWHEMVHIAQGFGLFSYIWSVVVAGFKWRDSKYEKEARAYEAAFLRRM